MDTVFGCSNNILVYDAKVVAQLQTYKGWFYVIITALLFCTFIRRHLSKLRATEQELEKHREHLQELVTEKTHDLNAAIEELHAANDELHDKNDIIHLQNAELVECPTDLKSTQQQLLQSEKMASLGVLTMGISHEINNPLNYIMGASVGLERYFEKHGSHDEPLTSFLLHSLTVGIDRTSNILKGLNQFNHTKQGILDDICILAEIVENCLVLLQPETTHRITFEKRYNDPLNNG